MHSLIRWLPPRLAVLACLLPSPSPAQNKGGGTTPPPNPEIAFEESNSQSIKIMNADGTNVRTVVSVRGNGAWTRSASWSANGTGLVFHGRIDGVEAIWAVNLDGSGRRQVTPSNNGYYIPSYPEWSRQPAPDGNHKIVFSNTNPTTLDMDLWVVNPDGTGLQNLTNTPAVKEGPAAAWSRLGDALYITRGTSLVVLQLGTGPGGLAVVGEVVLLDGVRAPMAPRAANTVDVVAFSAMGWLSSPVTPWRAYLLDVPTLTTRLLTGTVSDERWVNFSPDDSKLAFHRQGWGIVTINLDGSGERLIRSSGHTPRWKRP